MRKQLREETVKTKRMTQALSQLSQQKLFTPLGRETFLSTLAVNKEFDEYHQMLVNVAAKKELLPLTRQKIDAGVDFLIPLVQAQKTIKKELQTLSDAQLLAVFQMTVTQANEVRFLDQPRYLRHDSYRYLMWRYVTYLKLPRYPALEQLIKKHGLPATEVMKRARPSLERETELA